jgi:hypothetical protein
MGIQASTSGVFRKKHDVADNGSWQGKFHACDDIAFATQDGKSE